MPAFRRRVGDRERGQIFQQLPHFPSSWVRIPASSFLVTGAVFVLFMLDMASPGYGSFALIPNLRPQIATLTADIRSDLENLTRSKSLLTLTKKTQKPNKRENCQTLLDAYKLGATCHFEPLNYLNTSR